MVKRGWKLVRDAGSQKLLLGTYQVLDQQNKSLMSVPTCSNYVLT
jgi:hypothetical protein